MSVNVCTSSASCVQGLWMCYQEVNILESTWTYSQEVDILEHIQMCSVDILMHAYECSLKKVKSLRLVFIATCTYTQNWFFLQISCSCAWIAILTGTYPHTNLKVNLVIPKYECKFHTYTNFIFGWNWSSPENEACLGVYVHVLEGWWTHIHAHEMQFIK